MNSYLKGAHVLGAVLVTAKDPGALATAKSSGITRGAAALFSAAAPETLAQKVDAEIRSQMLDAFKDKGVAQYLDAKVVKDSPGDRKSNFGTGVALGAGAVGVGWALWRFVLRGLFSRKR